MRRNLRSLHYVRDALVEVFGKANVYFTERKSGATFPCAVFTLENEVSLPMISDLDHIVSIDVTVTVEHKRAAVALAKAEEVRQKLVSGDLVTMRTSYDIEEYATEEKMQDAGEPSTLFVASSSYTVYE